MTVTEFATIGILPPNTNRSPSVQAFFQKVAQLQCAASGHPVLFFEDAADPASVYILAGWPDPDTHHKWIQGEGNKELLAEMLSQTEVKGMVHLQINFADFPTDVTKVRLARYSSQTLPPIAAEAIDSGPVTWKGAGRCVESNGSEIYRLQALRSSGELGEGPEGGTDDDTTVIEMIRLLW
ncbi:hypothetical protein BC835DRAFT_1353984 [Cytidiella melzeri]|nr:hypothetical protein BC835DRAFT_1353984 [Cytidiella melzeri]